MKKKKKGTLVVPLIITILIVVLSIVTFIIKKNNIQRKDENITGYQNELDSIDMKNTLNVDIIDGEKVNNSKEVAKDREVDGLKLTDISLKTKNGVSMFYAIVKNESGRKFNENNVNIFFRDISGSVISIMEATIPDLQPGESKNIDAAITSDVTNASDITIELISKSLEN